MIIVGIDPGLSAMGYGVIEKRPDRLQMIDTGVIETHAKMAFPHRLMKLLEGVRNIIREHNPEVLVMEKPIYCQNMKTALILGQAGGMAALAAAEAELDFWEFTPLEIKKAITGNGRASKDQVQKMVQVLLGNIDPGGSDHISDALACAICYAHSEKQLKWLKNQ